MTLIIFHYGTPQRTQRTNNCNNVPAQRGRKGEKKVTNIHQKFGALEHLDVSHSQQIRLMKRRLNWTQPRCWKAFLEIFEAMRRELKQRVSRSASSGSSPLFASTVRVSRHSAECTTAMHRVFFLLFFWLFSLGVHSEVAFSTGTDVLHGLAHGKLTPNLQLLGHAVSSKVIQTELLAGKARRLRLGVVPTSISILCSKPT